MENERIALITGSNGRLGSRMASGFLNAGFTTIGLDRTPSVAGDWPVIQMDATSEDSVESAFRELVANHGNPSVVVHTIGMWDMAPFAETSLKDWNLQLQLNLTSSFLVFREAVRNMKDPGGSLIGIASRQGVDKGAAEQAGYSASKGGLVRLIESIAAEYENHNIRAFALAPSTILFGEEGKGVQADELVKQCMLFTSGAGKEMNGEVIRVYGNG